jgi:hypothetical protein
MTADADLTIVILRDIQSRLSSLEGKTDGLVNRMTSLEEKFDVTIERLSMVERGVTFCAAQINVMRRHMGIEEKKSDDEIRDLQERVTKLEDLVKP